jgi:hypothetical protein
MAGESLDPPNLVVELPPGSHGIRFSGAYLQNKVLCAHLLRVPPLGRLLSIVEGMRVASGCSCKSDLFLCFRSDLFNGVVLSAI